MDKVEEKGSGCGSDSFDFGSRLNKMMKKVVEGNKELNFRISLAKTTPMLESIPREETVQQLAEHLVGEVEQIAHLEPKAKPDPKPAVKKFEENPPRTQTPFQKLEQRVEGKKDEICKFFTSDQGCRKRKACKWSHVMDDQKRCWTCGAKDHYSTSCPRTEGGDMVIEDHQMGKEMEEKELGR